MNSPAPKKLLIAANIPDYPDDLSQFDEIWGVNSVYARFTDDPEGISKGRQLDRLYYFDHHKLIDLDFVSRVNALPSSSRVITKWPDAEIPRSEAFPLDAMIDHFGGLAYWTCSVAYTVAHAIFERDHGINNWEDITLAGMYHADDSWEYAHHKACVEFWIGLALGRRTTVAIHGQTMLLRPHTWESEVYGYEVNNFRRLHIDTVAAAYNACSMFPMHVLRGKSPDSRFQPRYQSIRQREDATLPMQEITPV